MSMIRDDCNDCGVCPVCIERSEAHYIGEGTDASAGDRPSHAEPLPFDIREALRQLRRDEMWTGMRTPNSPSASERTDFLVEHIVAMYESALKREERLRSALESWGRHHHWCTSLEAIGEDYLPCDCGLAELLANAERDRHA